MADIIEQDKRTSVNRRRLAKDLLRHENAVLVIILVGMTTALAGITKGLTIRPDNVRNIVLQSSTRGLASIGQLFVLLSANIDVSIGGLALLAATLGAALTTSTPNASLISPPLPLGVGMLVMLLFGLGVGAINGLSVTRIGVSALITTLAMWRMTTGGAYLLTPGHAIVGLPPGLAFIGQGYIGGLPVPIIIFVVAAVVAYFVLNYTTFGLSVRAVGSNPTSAYLSGVRNNKILMIVFLISGCLASLCGLIAMSRSMSATLMSSQGLELDSIAAVVIGGASLFGGKGSVIGAVIGTIILGLVNNSLNLIGVPFFFYDLVRGGIIFGAVAVDTLRRRRG